jgi:hypothetical protein
MCNDTSLSEDGRSHSRCFDVVGYFLPVPNLRSSGLLTVLLLTIGMVVFVNLNKLVAFGDRFLARKPQKF